MAAVQPKPDDSPDDRAEQFVAEHQARYSDAITQARAAASTTRTEAWRLNYERQRKRHDQTISGCVDTIRLTCDGIRQYDTNEDAEKEVRNAVKSLQDERVAFAAWLNRTVAPYKATVEVCEGITTQAVNAASDCEAKAPLHQRGLGEAVRKIIGAWPQADWDDEAGVVSVTESDGTVNE